MPLRGDGLDAYRRKRDRARTPEPFGGGAETDAAPIFVVQRHSARRLHYDVRLERGGALASWAVPGGLPTASGSRRRAIRTEDHPLEYARFEGEIPRGEYGGGTVDVYDRGPYEILREKPDGSLTVRLAGERLRGVWTFVPARLEGEERNWLLLKREEGARPARTDRPLPMLARVGGAVPAGPDWLHEVKWDGYRTLARLAEGEPTLWSRRGSDQTERFRVVARDLGRGLRTFDCVVDGEVCALDADGRPSFQLLQRGEGRLLYVLFDVLEVEGEVVTARPLHERRHLLERLVDERTAPVRLSQAFSEGEALFEAAHQQGLEGVVAKRASSRYVPGARSREWVKVKARCSEALVVVGYTKGEGSRERLGSLVVAARTEEGGLRYAGNVGAGLSEREIDRLLSLVAPLRRETPPLAAVPRDPRLRRGRVVWTEPRLVAEVEFSEWTADGHVRAPSYRGLREDVPPPGPDERELRRGARTVRLRRLQQLWWPAEGVRKADVVDYYLELAPVLLPHVRHRPFTCKRHFNGPRSPFAWIKDAPPELPGWVRTAPLPARSRGGELVRYPLVEDELALAWLVDFGCIDLHVWSSRADLPHRPDYVLFDLDPAGVPFADVVRAARLLGEALRALALDSFVRTTGGDGLHVLVPLERRHTHAEAREFSRVVAGALTRAAGDLVTTETARARRRGVYVDTKMNGYGQQVVSSYSLRPLPGAAVATPLAWDELHEALDPRGFTIEVVRERVARDGDLHAALLDRGQSLDRALAILA